jgi:hypothetical protein
MELALGVVGSLTQEGPQAHGLDLEVASKVTVAEVVQALIRSHLQLAATYLMTLMCFRTPRHQVHRPSDQ